MPVRPPLPLLTFSTLPGNRAAVAYFNSLSPRDQKFATHRYHVCSYAAAKILNSVTLTTGRSLRPPPPGFISTKP